MNQKVMQFNQQSVAINTKRRLLKIQSLLAQLNDEYEQIIWPVNLYNSIDHAEIRIRINYLGNSFQNIIESI